MGSDHFEGMSAADHLKKAREKTHALRSENHSLDPPGLIYAFLEKGKDGVFFALLLLLPYSFGLIPLHIALTLIASVILWTTYRAWHLSERRLRVLHRVISEEKYEIEHHREQEKQELEEMYRAKGFSGDLLKQIIDVLMADQNRLLSVMLEEELGLKPHTFEHPVKQALSSLLGVITSTGVIVISFLSHSLMLSLVFGVMIYIALIVVSSRIEKTDPVNAAFWGTSGLITTLAICYLLLERVGGTL